jgi:hypothetical protein
MPSRGDGSSEQNPPCRKTKGAELKAEEKTGGLRLSVAAGGARESLGRASGHGGEGDVAITLGRDRVIATMRVVFARHTLFLDVDHLPRAGDVPITPDYAATRQRGEPDDANHAHCCCSSNRHHSNSHAAHEISSCALTLDSASHDLCFRSWHFLHTRGRANTLDAPKARSIARGSLRSLDSSSLIWIVSARRRRRATPAEPSPTSGRLSVPLQKIVGLE